MLKRIIFLNNITKLVAVGEV